MKVSTKYLGRSGILRSGGHRILQMSPNLDRDKVAFDADLVNPLRFREAISALHDVVINDLKYQPRDKTAYEAWRNQQREIENQIRQDAVQRKAAEIRSGTQPKPSLQLKADHSRAVKRYWKARREFDSHLRKNDPELWRKIMPYDPVITVADDVLLFECFSADESSYGCLSVDRDCFGSASSVSRGTTNVDYSWDLYDNFQTLRTYRQTRFNINPDGFQVRTSSQEDYFEEKIDIPDGWLRGFMSLQSAMGIPMRKVTLSVGAMYSIIAFLKRNKPKNSPRAIRFELADGEFPKLTLEPYEKQIISRGFKYSGPNDEPIRIWGRRRLMTLARVLPLAEKFDVYLLGTGLPSFWVAKLGDMRLTLGLSGWTTNDWTKGSAVETLLPQSQATDALVAKAAENLHSSRELTLNDLTSQLRSGASLTANALNQLAMRGQVIYDLDAGKYRWRQVLPMALSDKEFDFEHPEQVAARVLRINKKISIKSNTAGPRGGWILTAESEGHSVEALIDADAMVKRGKCTCSWHFKFGIRNGPCRHIQALRDEVFQTAIAGDENDWYEKRLVWCGR